MRLLLASENFRLAADLKANYTDCEILDIETSFTGLLASMRTLPEEMAPDVVILEAGLESKADFKDGMDLRAAITEVRDVRRGVRVVVLTRSEQQAKTIADVGAETFTDFNSAKIAANLAAFLGLTANSETAKIIAVVSPQGGCGRSFIAAQIARQLRAKSVHPRSNSRGGVLLVELDLMRPVTAFDAGFPDTAFDSGRKTIMGILAGEPPRGDSALSSILSWVIPAEASQLEYDVLLAPHRVNELLALYGEGKMYPSLKDLAERVRVTLSYLARSYDAIVIDTGDDWILDPMPTLAIEQAQAVCAVVTPCASGVRAAMDMKTLAGHLLATKRFRLVINRVVRGSGDEYASMIEEVAKGSLEFASRRIPDASSEPMIWQDLTARLLDVAR